VIARDKTVEKEKGHSPKNNEKQRVKNLKKLNIANQVIIGNQGNKLKIIDNLRPDVICLGYDQRAKIKNLKKEFNKRKFNPKIIRLKAFRPHRFKSSFLIKHNP